MPSSSVNPASPTQPNGFHKVTLGEVLHYWWAHPHQTRTPISTTNDINVNNSLTPPQIWVAENVYPLVTPMRIFYFSLSLTSFLLAYGFFMETAFYKSFIHVTGDATHPRHHRRPLLFLLPAIGHTLWLIFLLFFKFCSTAYDRYRHHYLLKSGGELVVMILVSLLIMGIGHDKHHRQYHHLSHYSELAGLLTCGFLAIDALCIINLLKPGHHYSVFEATVTLTLHLGLMGSLYLGVSAVCFVFVILVVKNFLWRRAGDGDEAHTNQQEQHRLTWVAFDEVV